MFFQVLKNIWSNQITRSLLLIVTGLIVGLALYPSNDKVIELESKITQREKEIDDLKLVNIKKIEELKSKHEQIEKTSQEKLKSLELENTKLIKNKKFKKIITTLPDGTRKEEIIIITSETEVTEKLKKLEQDISRKHKKEMYIAERRHQEVISQLENKHKKELEKTQEEKSKEVTSSKKMGLGIRYSSDNSIGGHVHYHILGNIFVMSGLDLVDKSKLRYSVGVGLSL